MQLDQSRLSEMARLPMTLITSVLLTLAGIALCCNLWVYWLNSRHRTSDQMGASINFHAGNFIVGLLTCMAIALHLSWPWWLAILGLAICWIGSAPLMWIVNLILSQFR